MSRIRILSFNIHGGRSLDGKRDLGRVRSLMDRLDIDIGVFQEMETRPSRGGGATDVRVLAGSSRPYHCHGASLVEPHTPAGIPNAAIRTGTHASKQQAAQPADRPQPVAEAGRHGKGLETGLEIVQEIGQEASQELRETGWYGNLIVSRYPIQRSLVHNLETTAQREPRNAVDALILTPFGKLRVIGTHLSLSIFERRSEARHLIRLMQAVEETEKNPLLLMGDINEWQVPSRLLDYLNAHMTPIPCKATFPSLLPIFRLDRVWHDAPGLKVTAHRVPGKGIRQLSDHLPLVIEIDFDPPADDITQRTVLRASAA